MISYPLKVLRFYTYFTEMILDQGVEKERIRKCHLLFYLEDDSIQILEPTFSNSGIPQGKNWVKETFQQNIRE